MRSVFLVSLVSLVSTLVSDCDFRQKVELNLSYSIHNPGYPDYSKSLHCRWIAICPEGCLCKLVCPEVKLTQTSGCKTHHLLVSRSGDPSLQSAERYCGHGAFTATSQGRTLSLGVITSQRSRLKCTLSAEADDCQCGSNKLIMERIVGGRQSLNSYPSMAGVAELVSNRLVCGAAVVSRRHLLTAAHCAVGRRAEDVVVVAGMMDLRNAVSFASVGHTVKRLLVHPRYNSNTYDYDLAIIELAQDLEFDDYISAVCLPFTLNMSLSEQNLTVLGWGTLFPGGPKSDVLQEATVAVINQTQCRNSVPYLTDRQICTYTAGVDACQGDSGGPLLHTDLKSGRQYLVGLISHGQSCASGKPAVNTRLTAALQWIEDTSKVAYCKK